MHPLGTRRGTSSRELFTQLLLATLSIQIRILLNTYTWY